MNLTNTVLSKESKHKVSFHFYEEQGQAKSSYRAWGQNGGNFYMMEN